MRAFKQGIAKSKFLAHFKKEYVDTDSLVAGEFYNSDYNCGCAVGCSIQSINDIAGLD